VTDQTHDLMFAPSGSSPREGALINRFRRVGRQGVEFVKGAFTGASSRPDGLGEFRAGPGAAASA